MAINEAQCEAITKALRRFYGHFPHLKRPMDRLNALYHDECAHEEAENMLLLGESGAGKTTLLRYFCQKHPTIEHHDFTEVPILYTAVPSRCSIKSLSGLMLYNMGSLFWDKGGELERTVQLTKLISVCKTRMVILDEVNHLVDRGGEKTHYTIADWIKELSDATRKSFVLSGKPTSRQLLHANDQLNGRFGEEISIELLGADKKRIVFLLSVLKAFADQMKGLDATPLYQQEIAGRIAIAAGGRLRPIRRLLVRAVEVAYEKRLGHIDRDVLATAFKEVIFTESRPSRNPFNDKFSGEALTDPGEPYAPRLGK